MPQKAKYGGQTMSTADVNDTVMTAAARKMNALISMGAGKIIENTLNKLLQYQRSKYQKAIEQTAAEIKPFEEKHHMTSESFYQDFEEGKLGDSGDFFEWSALYENVLLYQQRITEIETLMAE